MRTVPDLIWETYVGDQTPAEFLEVSRAKGFDTIHRAVHEYVYVDWPFADEPEQGFDRLFAQLVGYLEAVAS